jgi:hypothetical protein
LNRHQKLMHRHTDSETGVGRWWKPFDVSYEFKYVGLNQRSSRRMASMPSCGVLPHADCTLSAEPGRSYELFFRHHAAGFFCITLLSSVLWGRGELLHCALTWTLLTALASGLLAGLFIRGSQTLQLMLVSGEILLSLLFLRAWWATPRLRYVWQWILVFAPPVTGLWIPILAD